MENKETMLIMGSTKSRPTITGVAEGPSMRAETMLLGVQAPVVGVMAGVGGDPSDQTLSGCQSWQESCL